MPDQVTEQRPRENVFDPDFMGWLQEKGLINVSSRRPTITGFSPKPPGPGVSLPIIGMEDVPVNIKQGMKDDFLHFIKGKGYPVLDEPLPSREEAAANLARSTEELRGILLQQVGETIGPIAREKVEGQPMAGVTAMARMQGPRAETIGPPRPTERKVELTKAWEQKLEGEKGFWAQIGDIYKLVTKAQPGNVAFLPPEAAKAREQLEGMFVETTAKGLSFGIVTPEILDKVDNYYLNKLKLSGPEYETMKQRRESVRQDLGYLPAKGLKPLEVGASLIPLGRIIKTAGAIGAKASVVPIVQRLITGMVAGGATGTAQIVGEKLAGEPFDIEKDLPKIPTHMLYWSLFEMGVLGARTVAKIVNWNLRYGETSGGFFKRAKGTGKYGGYAAGQGIEVETQYAPGRGPTTRQDFTVDEIRDIFRRGDPNYSGAGKIPVEPSPQNWERTVYDSIRDTSGWRESLRRGWMSPGPIQVPGEAPVVTGYNLRRAGVVPPTVGGAEIPMKPDWGQIFREGGAARPWPAPEIIETAPAAPGAATRPAPPPPTGPPPPGIAGVEPGAVPGETTPPPGPPPAGTAPPTIAGAPAPSVGAAPPPPAPKPKPKIKVTPQEDGSFTVETVTEPPVTARPITGAPPPSGKVEPPRREPEIEPEPEAEIPRPAAAPADTGPAKPAEARTNQALRDAINRIQADEGAPEDVRIIAQAARRSERLKKVVDALKARQRTDLLTGVGSDRALEKVRDWEKRSVVLFDLAGVKAANNDPKRGYKWSDNNIFKPAGRVFRAFGDDRVYRRGGTADEFPLIGKPGQPLEDLVKDAELISEQLDRAGVEHRFAPGNNFSEAEVGMAAAKDLGRIRKTTSPVVPENLAELEPFIVQGAEEVATIPGKVEEYLTMTGRPEDAIATMTRGEGGGIRIKRAIDGTFVKNKRTGLPDFPNRKAAWESYLEERKGRGLRGASPAFPSKRFIRAIEKPEDRARRIWRANQQAQASRGRTGAPKGGPKIFQDILEITSNKGIKPPLNARGGTMEEYRVNVPKFLKNKNGMAYDEIVDALEKPPYNYNFDEDDLWGKLKDAGLGRGAGPAFEDLDVDELGRQVEEMKKQFAPLMEEGESVNDFLNRMAREAAEDGFGTEPSDVDEYIAERLKSKKPGGEPEGGAPGEPPPTPFLVSIKQAKGQGLWWPDKKMKDNSPVLVSDPFIPASVPGAGPDVYSDNMNFQYRDENVIQIEGWKNTMRRYMGQIKDPALEEFVNTIKEIYEETDHYGSGPAPNVPFTPPFVWRAKIRQGYAGYKGGRMFHLKYLMGADATARLIAPMIGRSNFSMINPLYFGEASISGNYGTVGAMYDPSNGVVLLNPFYIDEKAFASPWGMAAWWRDLIIHELTHFWEPVHNEPFTSRLLYNNAQMADAWPHILRIAEKLLDQKAIIDKRTSFISLGPGRGQKVSNAVIRTAGEETAKAVALGKENKGGRFLYATRTKPEGEAPGGGGAGQPGETGRPGARRGAELPYPREAEAGGRPRLRFGERPAGLEPPPAPGPEGEFALTAPEEKAPPFKPEGLEGKQGVLGMEDAAPLFKGIKAVGIRPPVRPLPIQPKIPDTGVWTAVRTDDGGIYFGTEPNHYLLIQKLGLPPERVIGGGFIKDGVYEESPWSEAGKVGRDAREALGLPREVFAAVGIKPDKTMDEILRLTSGKFFPKEWIGNTEQEVKDNRQNLARFVLENYEPEMGPLENYINKNKAFFIRGESGRLGMAKIKRETQFPRTATGKEKDFGPERSAFAPESQPKHKRSEIPGQESKEDLFGAEEIRVVNALRSAAQAQNKAFAGPPETEDKLVEILKSRLLTDTPESFESIGGRLGMGRETVRENYYQMLERLRDSDVVKEIQKKRMIQLNLGPLPSDEDLRRLAKWIRKYFSSYRGADKIIDQMNDQRVGGKIAEIFEQTIDADKIKKWLDNQPVGTNEYAMTLMAGELSGDAYADIFNSALPFKIKEAMLTTRARIDRLSELIMTYGGLTDETKAAFERGMGKYLAKAYRLWEDRRWDPTPAQKDGFKRWLMNQYTMTDEQAEAFIESELAYGRNDEGARPRRRRKTRRIPTEHYIRRKELTPEWRAFAGEIDRLPWLALHTITKQATMAYNARFMDWISDYLPDHWADNYREAAQRGWQNSQFPEHNYAYGKLSGKWVDPELFQYIKNEVDVSRSDMENVIQKLITNPFKWTKTIGSYPSQARNFLGNIMFSHGLRNNITNPLNWKWYKRATDIHLNQSGTRKAEWSELIRLGVTETQFYGREIPRMHDEIMRFDPETLPEQIWDKTVKWPIDTAGELYNFGDSLYRVSSHLKNTAPRSEGGFGMTPEESLEEINAGLQNYRKLPVVVDVLRRWPLVGVFVSFKWNVAKIIGLQAKKGVEEMKNPATRGRGISRIMRWAMLLALPAIASEVSKRVFDVDEEKVKELERWYPEYRRNGRFIYFRGDEGQLKVFDLSYIIPTGDFERFGRALLKGDVESAMSALDFLSHPLIDAWSIAVKGVDPTWGTKYRSFVDRVKAVVSYLYLPASMPIPSFEGMVHGDLRPGALTGSQMKAIIDAFNQQPDKYGRIKKLPEEVKNFFTGIRTWDVEPDKLLTQAAILRNAQIKELKGEFSNWVIRNSKAPEWEREDKKRKFLAEVEKLAGELKDIGKIRAELEKDGFKATRY